MALRFTPNSRSPNLSLSANVVARFSSVLSMDWGNITGKPSYVDAVDANVSTWLQIPTSANLRAALTDETGTGAAVFATSPTLVTPNIGVATATSINGNFWTAGTGTLTIGAGKTLRSNNTLTFAGTDGTTLTFQGTDTYVGRATTDTLTNKTLTSPTITGAAMSGSVITTSTYNGNTWTAGTGTLTIAASKTLTANNTLALGGTDGTTITFQGTDTYVGRTTTDTLTNKTLTLPVLSGSTNPTTSGALGYNTSQINFGDGSANHVFATTDQTQTLTNKTIDTAGPNTIKVGGVTLSTGQYPGETTTGSATAGNIGEFVVSNVLQASAAALTSGTILNVTSISLTAGDWDIYGVIGYIPGGTTTITRLGASIETSNSVFSSIAPNSTLQYYPSFAPGANAILFGVGPLRVSLSGTTSYYLNAVSTFATSTNAAFGYLRARRAR